MLQGAALLVAAALLWWLALAPALATLRQAEVQRPLLDAQWQRMQALQAEAAALKASPRMGQDEALRALETLVKQRQAHQRRRQADQPALARGQPGPGGAQRGRRAALIQRGCRCRRHGCASRALRISSAPSLRAW